MDVNDISYWIERLGLPIVILIVLCWMAITATKTLWLWWAPRIEKWAESWFTSNEKTQETYRNVAAASLDLQKSNSVTLQGMALTVSSMHNKLLEHVPCPLGEDPSERFAELRKEMRTLRHKTVSQHIKTQRHEKDEHEPPQPPPNTPESP